MNRDIFGAAVAKKYSRAFLACYANRWSAEQIAIIKQCSAALEQSPRTLFSLSRIIKRNHYAEAIDYWSKKLGVPSEIKNLIALLASHNRIHLLPDCLHWIATYFYENNNYSNATITSAIPLNTNDKKIISAFLQKKIGGTIVITYQLDSSLIAGIRIRSQNYLWEKSVAQLLRDIKLHNLQ